MYSPSELPNFSTTRVAPSDLSSEGPERVRHDFTGLPNYAHPLLAYHQAHQNTLKAIIGSLPIQPGDRVVDVATGDGTYAMLMTAAGAKVAALDADKHFLALAEKRANAAELAIEFIEGEAQHLPFDTGSLAGSFCAQSLFSIEDVDSVLAEMTRVVRPGGWVGVMENDSLHHILMPWPPDLELQLLEAEYKALFRNEKNAKRFYLGRRLNQVLREAGLGQVTKTCFSTQRNAPVSADDRVFLQHYLSTLVARASPFLDDSARRRAETLSNPQSSNYLLDAPDFNVTIIDFLVWGRVESLSGILNTT